MNKIMIVEDEAIIALRLQQRLTSMGFDVIGVAYSGEEAVETARDLRPDLILSDIMLPGKLDGIQMAEIVKSALNIPLIFLTAYSEDKIMERAKQVEPYGYIVKPFQDCELKDTIEFALYKKNMESCYEYLGCDKKDCIMHGRKDTKRCWEVEGALHNHPGIQIVRHKLEGKKEDACNHSGCIYYKAAKDRNIV